MSVYTAKWICESDGCESPIFRKKFNVADFKSAEIDICGLGWFELYVNEKKVSDSVLCPGTSNYSQLDSEKCKFNYPWNDVMTDTRVYFCNFDITELIKNGENLMSVHLGNGYWNQKKRLGEGDFSHGAPILCFSLKIEFKDGTRKLIESDENVLSGKSGIIENNLFFGEVHDLAKDNIHKFNFDESCLKASVAAEAPQGKLCRWEANYDKIVKSVVPTFIGSVDGKHIYDVGKNISGWIAFDTETDGEIIMEFAEEICGDKELNFRYSGPNWVNCGRDQIQSCRYFGDGKRHTDVHPHFSWQGFRYFSVEGNVENLRCDIVHTDLEQTGFFVCDDKTINAILDMYIRSELTNIHGCIPSDCPHRERLGYTGDGQITCETVMHIFDARKMYCKWMQDIADSQCVTTGRVQNTAPFFGGGGGPAGWGGAIFVIPYTYYKMYGDAGLAKKYASNMDFYFSYLENRCEDNLLCRSEPGCWCLGDWCWIGCSATSVELPQAYVNTAYLIKFYNMILELDSQIGLGIDRSAYEKRREKHIEAVVRNFYDEKTGDFAENNFGANVFAVDIGIGDERTFKNLAEKYEKFDGFDTGIFATEFLIRLLGERGRADLVYKLLASKKFNHSFYSMYEQGATTLWETWNGDASHNHPMFGGCMKAMWQCFLGINPISAGFKAVKISPCDIEELGNMRGSMVTPQGKISVCVFRNKTGVKFIVGIPQNCYAEFSFRGKNEVLHGGINIIVCE